MILQVEELLQLDLQPPPSMQIQLSTERTATASVTAGVITSVTITDGGFGYDVGSSPPVLVESDKTKREDVFSVDAKGDFGDIVGINTWLPGTANRLPQLTFTLKSQFNDNTNLGYGYSSLNDLGVEFSGLEKGRLLHHL